MDTNSISAVVQEQQKPREFEVFAVAMHQRLNDLSMLSDKLSNLRNRVVGPPPPRPVSEQNAQGETITTAYSIQMNDFTSRFDAIAEEIAEDIEALSRF